MQAYRSVIVLLVFAGCYNPLPQSGVQQCGPKGECADGYYCAVDNHCYKKGLGPDLGVPRDMAMPCTADMCKAASKVCDPDTHACVDCLLDGDCPLGKVCNMKACVDGCTDMHGCPSGMCTNGKCSVCKADQDCTDPMLKRCDVPSGKCVACLATADCAPGDYCDPNDHTCHQGCDADNQCKPTSDGGNQLMKCCNHACYDVNSDQAHCGACATDCGQQTCCSGFCSDVTMGDIMNCGGCGMQCKGGNASWTCMQSACAVSGCMAGFKDCNMNPGDGCEAATATDVGNCGMCGNKCAAPNAVNACANGSCTITGCMMGFADCNNNAGDGCETNTAGDTNNCGGCGVKCALANAAAACIGGKCVIASCSMGFSNCDNLDNTGCESATASDPNNCGGCNMKCAALPNVSMVACSNSMCTVGSCLAGFANCDMIPANGCESQLATDKNNCGMCGKACGNTANVATTKCSASACQVATCDNGFADCNGQYADGCEANLSSDKNNCGMCGKVCGNSCVNGQCANCNTTVLVIGDTKPEDQQLVNAINAAGMNATLVQSVTTYNGVPAANTFGAVVILVGDLYGQDMPAAGQQSIVNANAAGTGVVFTEWAAYNATTAVWQTLRTIEVLTRTGGITQTQTYTLTSANHPVWTGLPNSFVTVNAMGGNTGMVVQNGGVVIATCTECTNAGVVVKDAVGRIAQAAFAADYQATGVAWTNDANTTKLMTNMTRWAAHCM